MLDRHLTRSLGFAVSCGLVAAACGGSPAQGTDAQSADGVDATRGASAGGGEESMSVSGETGALSKEDVQATFRRAMPAINRCVAAGRKRLPFLSGDVGLFLQVDLQGRAATTVLTKSTFGDHQVEDCLLKTLRSQQWPRPVGGKIGEVIQSFSFDRDPDEEEPIQWTAQSLAEAMAADAAADAEEDGADEPTSGPPPFDELKAKLDQCRQRVGASQLLLTMHFDEDGMPRGVGLSSPDAGGRQALDCIKTTIETTSFPSPRSNFAKMTMSIP
ncbi:MAG: AgmX/PglI C-terminal domain-containing protein [Deltaproteobacteria bacterium]|jgi:hypothetical protein|nr:AgmX/PglI C-terminal domain-containing protein [Deltaproteobacteria bacterium]MBW2533321.1 AgmX/PglI C-terminal domain-containing protein [Deltaproteobacteria bacterium]